MKKTLQIMAVALSFGLLFGCSESNQKELPQNEAGLLKDDGKTLSGNYTTSSGRISYSSITDSKNPEKLYINISLESTQLEATVRFDNESFLLGGQNAVLSTAQKESLLQVADQLYKHIEQKTGETVALHEFALVRLLEYWANSPSNYAYAARSYNISGIDDEISARMGNEGVTCIKKNTNVNAEYDDSRGTHSERVLVGSTARSGYGCMGRCGADCGKWWIPSAWTKDCMDHDQCSHKNNSSGGSGDSNCGDEFDEAADDWLFGVTRGCRG